MIARNHSPIDHLDLAGRLNRSRTFAAHKADGLVGPHSAHVDEVARQKDPSAPEAFVNGEKHVQSRWPIVV